MEPGAVRPPRHREPGHPFDVETQPVQERQAHHLGLRSVLPRLDLIPRHVTCPGVRRPALGQQDPRAFLLFVLHRYLQGRAHHDVPLPHVCPRFKQPPDDVWIAVPRRTVQWRLIFEGDLSGALIRRMARLIGKWAAKPAVLAHDPPGRETD